MKQITYAFIEMQSDNVKVFKIVIWNGGLDYEIDLGRLPNYKSAASAVILGIVIALCTD